MWNSLPSCLVKKKISSETTKSKYNVYFSNKVAKEMEQRNIEKNAVEITVLVNFLIDALVLFFY